MGGLPCDPSPLVALRVVDFQFTQHFSWCEGGSDGCKLCVGGKTKIGKAGQAFACLNVLFFL